jgi:MFS family permease
MTSPPTSSTPPPRQQTDSPAAPSVPARNRVPFVALITSYTISVAGTSMSAIAIPWLVLTTTGSAAKTGLVAFAETAAYVAAQMLAGPIVDRVGLRRSFVVGDIAAAVAMGAIPLVYAVGGLTLAALLALVACAGAVRGAADCANSALVPTTAEAGGVPLERAASLNTGANRMALLVGAPLGGTLVTLIGSSSVVGIDAATFAVAAVMMAVWVRVPGSERPLAADAGSDTSPDTNPDISSDTDSDASPDTNAETGRRRGPFAFVRDYGRDLNSGLRFVRGDRLLLGIITMVAVANLLDQGMAVVMLPVWVHQRIGSAGALGLLTGAMGLGALLGNLVSAWLGPRLARRPLYSVGFLLSGAPRFAVVAFASTVSPVLVAFLVGEFFGGSLNSVIGATAYERIPEHLRARVLGAVRASAWVGIPFGSLFGGYAVEAWGIRNALLAFGAAYLITTLAPFVFPSWSQMRRPAPAAT